MNSECSRAGLLARLASCLGEVEGELDLCDPGDESLAGKNTEATIRQLHLKEVGEIGRDPVEGGGGLSPLRWSGRGRLDLGLGNLGNLRNLRNLGNLWGSLLDLRDLGNLRSLLGLEPDESHDRLKALSEQTSLLALNLHELGQILDLLGRRLQLQIPSLRLLGQIQNGLGLSCHLGGVGLVRGQTVSVEHLDLLVLIFEGLEPDLVRREGVNDLGVCCLPHDTSGPAHDFIGDSVGHVTSGLHDSVHSIGQLIVLDTLCGARAVVSGNLRAPGVRGRPLRVAAVHGACTSGRIEVALEALEALALGLEALGLALEALASHRSACRTLGGLRLNTHERVIHVGIKPAVVGKAVVGKAGHTWICKKDNASYQEPRYGA